eukprot:6417145-Prymnesium_polylepis.1
MGSINSARVPSEITLELLHWHGGDFIVKPYCVTRGPIRDWGTGRARALSKSPINGFTQLNAMPECPGSSFLPRVPRRGRTNLRLRRHAPHPARSMVHNT